MHLFSIKYCKQWDGCTMGGPLSVAFSDICVKKLEKKNAILSPKKPKNCKRFVDDVFVTIQKSFFNTKIYFNSGFIASKMHLKVTKLAPR